MTVSKCLSCGMKSEKIDSFRDLQLSFPSNSKNHSITTLINYYIMPEKLCGGDQYHCDKCNTFTDGEKETLIIEPPSSLILTIKCFSFDMKLERKNKLLHSVRLENIITLNNISYELYAAVIHYGSNIDYGHYYTFGKDGDNWFKFNDCSVTKITSELLYNLEPQ